MSEVPELDGMPVMFVHPDDVNLPEVKHKAALDGVSVVASTAVERGKMFVAPRGVPRFG